MADDDGNDRTPEAWRGHTRWQRFVRFLFRFLGPAQTGLPPYATPAEREALRRGSMARPARSSDPPPGYQVRIYTDAQGIVHRTLVPVESPERPEKRDPP